MYEKVSILILIESCDICTVRHQPVMSSRWAELWQALWNSLPSNLRQSDLTLHQFRRAL